MVLVVLGGMDQLACVNIVEQVPLTISAVRPQQYIWNTPDMLHPFKSS